MSSQNQNYPVLLGALGLLLLVYPVVEPWLPEARLALLFPLLVMLTAIFVVRQQPGPRLGLAALLVAAIVPAALGSAAPRWVEIAGQICELIFYAAMSVFLLFDVFHRSGVDRARLWGAACVYLLIGAVFGAAYSLSELLAPGSFALPDWVDAANPRSALNYFSFVTLTTLGYGEIAPLADGVRSLAILESIVGILFPAILIGRIVGLYTSGDTSIPFEPPSARLRLSGAGLELLFAVEILQIASFPYVPFGVTRIVGVAVLVAAFSALGRHPRRLLLGLLLGVPALLRWGGFDPIGPTSIAGTLFTSLFLGFVTGALLLDVMRRDRVDREVVFGAASAYVLIGITFAEVFSLVYLLDSSSISLGAGLAPEAMFGELHYLSFVTLTTLGYGDILPLSGAAQSVANVESVIGVLFPSILIARLVALYSVDSERNA